MGTWAAPVTGYDQLQVRLRSKMCSMIKSWVYKCFSNNIVSMDNFATGLWLLEKTVTAVFFMFVLNFFYFLFQFQISQDF